ncbi:basic helix-loop-helix (bHLH) DNA-bindingsuperfamily protein [Striga asiatica]|uniref:Basic helix-loop-helix (BHLH) DNA-bindingsuperfamily protein n=1 Tax=Striga asiatica TaxID=4170 RepID=A0A5A7P461_STRAF|nr:basic helix-loop-helix (bHLH) DNA-bindingsuperfamily protein [Striga asiatica]
MEENYEEMFDLKHILPEIYSTNRPQIHEHEINIVNSWDYSANQTNHSTASSSSAAPKILSFETSNVSTGQTASNNRTFAHELANNKDYNSLASSQILNFSAWAEDNEYEDSTLCQKNGALTVRSLSQARDHLMAERKRRENLGQLFISLSKVVPGLKKLDKASLLEDAINYLKALQERVSSLEQGLMSTKSFTNDISRDDEYHSSDKLASFINNNNIDNENCRWSTISESAPAEIKARVSDKHVLVKVHCKKQIGLMSRIPCQMEKIHLNVVDMRILPFGDDALDITLLAQMTSEFRGTVKDIVDHLHTLFFNTRLDKVQHDEDNTTP